MATISISTELDVLDKYTSLTENSLNSESFYARTIGTVVASDAALTDESDV